MLGLWGPVVAWAGIIFYLSSIASIPGASFMLVDFVIKKSGHMAIYAILYYLIVRALEQRTKRNFVLAFVLVAVYGASDELHQAFVAGRSATLMDVGFDSLGASLMFIIMNRFKL